MAVWLAASRRAIGRRVVTVAVAVRSASPEFAACVSEHSATAFCAEGCESRSAVLRNVCLSERRRVRASHHRKRRNRDRERFSICFLTVASLKVRVSALPRKRYTLFHLNLRARWNEARVRIQGTKRI